MANCSKCKAKVEPDARTCPGCGCTFTAGKTAPGRDQDAWPSAAFRRRFRSRRYLAGMAKGAGIGCGLSVVVGALLGAIGGGGLPGSPLSQPAWFGALEGAVFGGYVGSLVLVPLGAVIGLVVVALESLEERRR
jgi:hypothetical protein